METTTVLPDKRISKIANDARKSAEAVNLIYVSDKEPGIRRMRNGKGFVYIWKNRKITDTEELIRFKSLVIPPAWTDVWICRHANGHIQCTGLDANKRKQYRYHSQWIRVRNQTKYYRLLEFGKALPVLRRQIEADLSVKELTEEKVIAAAISVMEKTYIRIGSNAYEKLYGSYGLTTLKDKHVKINGSEIEIAFKGKKSIMQKVSIHNRKLARIIKQCRDIPGKELFQYEGADSKYYSIDSGKVNNYIKRITGSDFTAKDFRTWAGTINALRIFRKLGAAESVTEIKKNILEALNYVSSKLGNTKAVCRKYYIHPRILELYESKALHAFMERVRKHTGIPAELSEEEQMLMTILSS